MTPGLPFRDRHEAGRALAELVASTLADGEQPIVLALPRGGVPVAFEVATALAAPLDVIVVRKLGVPIQPELGMGAIGEDGVCVLNPEVIGHLRITEDALRGVEERERAELERRAAPRRAAPRRAARYRNKAPMIALEGRTVVIVDDGLATGSTARAAMQVARAHGARRVVLAVPVAPAETLEELAPVADDVVCVASPHPFAAIGQWYDDFSQTSDVEVSRLLDRARREQRDRAGRSLPARDDGDPDGVPRS